MTAIGPISLPVRTVTAPVLQGALRLGETFDTAYRGDRGKTAYDHSQAAHLELGTTSLKAFRGDYGNTAYLFALAVLNAEAKEYPDDEDDVLLFDNQDEGVMKKVKLKKIRGQVGDVGAVTDHATLTIGTGDSAIVYQAVAPGTEGQAISVQHADIYKYAATTLQRYDDKLVITPGIPAMKTSGTTPAIPDCQPVRYGSGIIFASDSAANINSGANRAVYYNNGTKWYVWKWNASSELEYSAEIASTADRPDFLSGETWDVTCGENQPVIVSDPPGIWTSPFKAKDIVAAIRLLYPTWIIATYSGTGDGLIEVKEETNLLL